MTEQEFCFFVDDLFSSFCKNSPKYDIKMSIYRQVSDYPYDFCEFAREKIIDDYDVLPANLGKVLRLVVYPAYQASHGLHSYGWGDPACPYCHGHGMLSVWRIKEDPPSPTGENAPCVCCTRLDLFPGWTRGVTPEEVEASGICTMKNLFLSQPWHDESIKKRVPPARMATTLQESAYKQDFPDKKADNQRFYQRGTFVKVVDF